MYIQDTLFVIDVESELLSIATGIKEACLDDIFVYTAEVDNSFKYYVWKYIREHDFIVDSEESKWGYQMEETYEISLFKKLDLYIKKYIEDNQRYDGKSVCIHGCMVIDSKLYLAFSKWKDEYIKRW